MCKLLSIFCLQLEEDKFKKIRRDDSVEKLADEIREVKVKTYRNSYSL